MNNISICITFIAGILGIAYPVLLQVVSRLDEKYNSLILVDLFNKEYERNSFTITLKLSLIFILLWMLKLKPFFNLERFGKIITNSAEYLLIISTFLGIVFFFLFVRKILIYYTPSKLLNFLKSRNDKSMRESNLSYLYAMSDLLYFSIKNQNEKIVELIWVYISKLFREFHDSSSDSKIIFPNAYYEVNSRTIEELANIKSNRFSFLTQSTAGNTWMLGSSVHKGISTTTYDWIWKNLRMILDYDRNEFVVYHWENASRYFGRSLNHIPPNISKLSLKATNQKEIAEREAERKIFLNFHYALGGLLLYKRKYELIYKMFRFTQSEPPEYLLLPKRMDQVFDTYFDFKDPFEGRYPFINSDYRFSDSGGFEMDSEVRGWICSFIALLFLRQFPLASQLSIQNPLASPRVPTTDIQKKQWIDGLTNFRLSVAELYNSKELLKVTGLDIITDTWCDENHKPTPLEFIDNLKKDIQDSFNDRRIDQ